MHIHQKKGGGDINDEEIDLFLSNRGKFNNEDDSAISLQR